MSDSQIHNDLYSKIAALVQRLGVLEKQHRTIIINVFMGGTMDFTRVNAAAEKNTTVGGVFGEIYPEIARLIRETKGDQAKLDELAAKLEDANTAEETRVAALKDLIVPATPTLTAAWNGPSTATVGESFQGAVAVSGGRSPYTITQDSGALPSGLSFNADGTVAGIPETAGAFTFGGGVTDTVGGSANWTASIVVS